MSVIVVIKEDAEGEIQGDDIEKGPTKKAAHLALEEALPEEAIYPALEELLQTIPMPKEQAYGFYIFFTCNLFLSTFCKLCCRWLQSDFVRTFFDINEVPFSLQCTCMMLPSILYKFIVKFI